MNFILKSHLVVAESDGEPPIVAIDDLNAVVSRAAGQRHDILGQIFLGYYSSNLIFITLGLQAITCLMSLLPDSWRTPSVSVIVIQIKMKMKKQ